VLADLAVTEPEIFAQLVEQAKILKPKVAVKKTVKEGVTAREYFYMFSFDAPLKRRGIFIRWANRMFLCSGIFKIFKQSSQEAQAIDSPQALEAFRLKYLGKKGIVAAIFASLGRPMVSTRQP
jgi:hypothetical protein